MTSPVDATGTKPETRRETLGYWGYRTAEWLAMSPSLGVLARLGDFSREQWSPL